MKAFRKGESWFESQQTPLSNSYPGQEREKIHPIRVSLSLLISSKLIGNDLPNHLPL